MPEDLEGGIALIRLPELEQIPRKFIDNCSRDKDTHPARVSQSSQGSGLRAVVQNLLVEPARKRLKANFQC